MSFVLLFECRSQWQLAYADARYRGRPFSYLPSRLNSRA